MSAIEVNISSSLSSTVRMSHSMLLCWPLRLTFLLLCRQQSECHILLLCLEVVVNSQNVTFKLLCRPLRLTFLLLCRQQSNVTFNVIVSAIEVNISSSLSSTVRMSHSMLLCRPLRLTFLLLCRQQSECHIQCYCVGH